MEFNRQFTITLTNGTTTLIVDNTSTMGISSASMSLDEQLCTTDLILGSMIATKFEVEIFNLSIDVSNWDITVTAVDNGTNRSIFKGIMDSATYDNLNVSRHIIAYDKMYTLRDFNVADFINNLALSDSNKITLKSLRTQLLAYVGLVDNDTPQINDSIEIGNIGYFTKLNFGDLLQMICELQCTFPHIARDGTVTYIKLGTDAKSVDGLYETGSCEFEDYTTKQITGVGVCGDSTSISQIVGTDTNAYLISGNLLLLSMTPDMIDTVVTPIYDYLATITYTPCKLPMIVNDLSFNLGDKITTQYGTHYIMQLQHSGSLLVEQTITCVSSGESQSKTAKSYNDTLIQGIKMSSIEQNIDSVTVIVQNVQSDTAAMATIVQQTAEGLATTIQKLEGSDGNGGLTERVAILESNAEEFTLTFNTKILPELNSGIDNATQIATETATYIKGDETGVTIGKTDSNTKAHLGNSKLEFIQNDVSVAEFGSTGSQVAKELKIGDTASAVQSWRIFISSNGSHLTFTRKDS